MPEGDIVYRTATRLNQVFAGHALTASDLRWPTLATVDLTGATTLEVLARGKHLLHRLDSGLTLHSHLRMDGSWRVQPASQAVPRRRELRAVLGTPQYTALGLSLGMLDLVRTRDEHTLIGHLGPDILQPWDAAQTEAVVARLRAGDASLGAALLDQRIVAGFGTIWTSEACFAARLDPLVPVAEVDARRLTSLLAWAHTAMRASAGASGASPAATNPGRGHGFTWVHHRNRQPCRRCGTLIREGKVGRPPQQRVLQFCPACQRSLRNGE